MNLISLNFNNKQDLRRRLDFLIKLILFTGILVFRSYYKDLHTEYLFPRPVLTSLIFFILISLLISLSRIMIITLYIKKKRRQNSFIDNFILGVNQISSLLTAIALIISIFILFNITLKEFYTSISIIAVALVLIFKEYIANTLNGMVLMFSNQICLNDKIQIGQQKGKVININLKHVIIKDEQEAVIYIPNSQVMNCEVINYSRVKDDKVIVDFELPPNAITDIGEFRDHLKQELLKFNKAITPDSLQVWIKKIQKDMVAYRAEAVLNLKNEGSEREVSNMMKVVVSKYLSKTNQKNSLRTEHY